MEEKDCRLKAREILDTFRGNSRQAIFRAIDELKDSVRVYLSALENYEIDDLEFGRLLEETATWIKRLSNLAYEISPRGDAWKEFGAELDELD